MSNHTICNHCGRDMYDVYGIDVCELCHDIVLGVVCAEEEAEKDKERIRLLGSLAALKEIRDRCICWYPAHRSIEDAFSDQEKAAFDDAIQVLEQKIKNV